MQYIQSETEWMKNEKTQVISINNMLSMLQAFQSGKVQQLEKALLQINTLQTVIQWIPSHCDFEGNEKAEFLAKTGAEQEKENNPTRLTEMNIIIKPLFKPSQTRHAYK